MPGMFSPSHRSSPMASTRAASRRSWRRPTPAPSTTSSNASLASSRPRCGVGSSANRWSSFRCPTARSAILCARTCRGAACLPRTCSSSWTRLSLSMRPSRRSFKSSPAGRSSASRRPLSRQCTRATTARCSQRPRKASIRSSSRRPTASSPRPPPRWRLRTSRHPQARSPSTTTFEGSSGGASLRPCPPPMRSARPFGACALVVGGPGA
mmetsp:Transcript_139948/g.446569  ORF Transcript_139948/g.446569 Transcript_139948/m.446569 type:complete len:210 (-) Transcript_139948:190-819(-)